MFTFVQQMEDQCEATISCFEDKGFDCNEIDVNTVACSASKDIEAQSIPQQ